MGQVLLNRAKQQNLRTAKKKANSLKSILSLTKQQVVVVEDWQTKTARYQLGLTDLAIALCLDKEDDERAVYAGKYYPRSLRVDEKAVDKSSNAEFVDFIFAKELDLDGESRYKRLIFKCEGKNVSTIFGKRVDLQHIEDVS